MVNFSKAGGLQCGDGSFGKTDREKAIVHEGGTQDCHHRA